MAELFASALDTERLIMGLELYVGRKNDSENWLLIFGEVQEQDFSKHAPNEIVPNMRQAG